jgi:hypothetical protein
MATHAGHDARQGRGERPGQDGEGEGARYELCDLRTCASLGRFDRGQLAAFFAAHAGLDPGDFAILAGPGTPPPAPLATFLRPVAPPMPGRAARPPADEEGRIAGTAT